MKNTDIFDKFIKSEPITKGWSEDKKYCVTKEDGTKYLLRITKMEHFEKRKTLFEMIKCVAKLNIPMCLPIEFGICKDGVYVLQSWIEGDDVEVILPMMTETEQYVLGLKSGEILRKIHSIPAPKEQEGWATRFNHKINTKIEKYRACGIRFDGDDEIIEYIENNRHLLNDRPQCFQHGDYHIGNMMMEDGNLVIIDFDRFDFGDPWEEFNRIVWSATVSPHFATGQLNGYFGGKPPMEFFRLLMLYISSNTISSIYWAIPFGETEITIMKNQAKDVLTWFDNMKNPMPTWYLKDFYIQYINNVPYKLKFPFDMSFIDQYGQVFKVYDDQDSGNICYGVKNGDNRYFIKFAGAPTERGGVSREKAIATLKSAVRIYQDLAHPNLIKLIKAEEIGGGFAAIFEWTDGECMGRMYPKSRQKFLQLPYETRLDVFADILDFHRYVISQGYVAIDFYDGSILYDFNEKKTLICDIDFYAKTPYINTMGRLWGSSRFMSPEEFTLGAAIDDITNVYTMGVTAFALFGDEKDKSFDKWQVGKALYEVALKAVSDNKNERYGSIKEFITAWNEAKGIM